MFMPSYPKMIVNYQFGAPKDEPTISTKSELKKSGLDEVVRFM